MANHRWRFAARLVVATLILDLVLIMPNHPDALNLAALEMFPLELPVLLCVLLLLPPGLFVTRWVELGFVLFLTLVSVIKIADFFIFLSFNRGFNLVVDWNLVAAGVHTLAEAIGYFLTVGLLLLTLFSVGLFALLLRWAIRAWTVVVPNLFMKRLTVASLFLATSVAVAEVGHVAGSWHLTYKPPGDTFTFRTAWRYVGESVSTWRSLRHFEQIVQQQPVSRAPGLLSKLKGLDVLLVFVESYGRSSFDNPQYAATHVKTLLAAQDRLAKQGLAMRSGWLTAAMVGGQSWLSHSTLASGLWVSDQGRYRALLNSGRSTLFHDAKLAGFRTVAIMPAIRLDWPDGEFFGFDAIYPSQKLGYQGLPFNWVTVPDQFTFAALDRLERQNPEGNLFVQLALISSHAPFTPVPKLLPWSSLGDGSEFNDMARSGSSPEEVWADSNRVRDQFRQAIDYSLQTVFDYIERSANRRQLVIVLGDHEPAKFISGVSGQDVAVHLIGAPEVLASIDPWGFTPGMVPDPNLAAWRMDQFRERFVRAFSD